MGAHYRSLHVQGKPRAAVLAAVESLVRGQPGRVLVGPELNGWVGLYPNDDLPPESFAAALARQLGSTVLELGVYDSDVFFYNLFRGGQFVDEYCSDPDYFEEASPEEHERLRGKPEVFREWVGSDAAVTKLAALLGSKDKEAFLFEDARMEQFATILGIRNTAASYDYLRRGDCGGIQGRKEFVHVPDLTAEKNAAKSAAAALRGEMKRLKEAGILCFESVPKKGALFLGEAVFDPLRGGILFGWGALLADASAPRLFSARPPWTAEPEPVVLHASTAMPNNLVFSRTGKWLAYRDDRLRLWDWAERRPVEGIDSSAYPAQFSADERRLLCKSSSGVEVVSVEGGEVIRRAAMGDILAWHPEGRFVLTRPRQDQLGILDLEGSGGMKVLYSGPVSDRTDLASFFSGTLQQAGISEAQITEMKHGFIRGADQVFSAKFSPDGRLLFCATTRGMRVLEWEKVLAAEKATPAPLFAASPIPPPPPEKPMEEGDYLAYVYDTVFDEARNRLLFCGIEGAVRFFNLNDGTTGVLLRPPGDNYIWRLQMSADREFLCCFCTPPAGEKNKKANRIQVWNYRLLRAAVGLD